MVTQLKRSQYQITNVITTANLKQSVDAPRFVNHPWGRYDLEYYGGRCGYVKDKKMIGRVTVFLSGKMISTGAKSVAELMVTEVELSPSESDELGQWIEVHNPTKTTLGGAFTIRQPACQDPSFFVTSTEVKPNEYAVIEIFDKEHLANREGFPTENTTLSLWVGPSEVYRTPALGDTAADSRTWQLNGTQWVFVDQTPTRTIPEFGSGYIPIIGIMLVLGMITIVIGRTHFLHGRK